MLRAHLSSESRRNGPAVTACARPPDRAPRWSWLAPFLLLTLWVASPAASQDRTTGGLRYTLSPVIVGTAWQNELGLKDGLLYGGKLGIDFGRTIGLEASYLISSDLDTRLTALGLRDTAGVPVTDQSARVRRFGADLLLRWPSDRFAPFAKVGGGVIRFEPETGEHADKIEVRAGAGLNYTLNRRLRAGAWAELSRLRLDRYTLAPEGTTGGAYPLDPESEQTRDNVSVGISLDYALGQARFRPTRGVTRLQPFSAFEIEPFMGRLDFDDRAQGIMTVAGARLGGELNPYVGWGLYYWRGMASDLSDTRPVQSYGGEARFGLSSSAGPQPYLILGAGQMDYCPGYLDNEGNPRKDQMAFILGAGVRASIAPHIHLSLSARDYLFSMGRLDDVSGTEELSHNWLLSGALVFGIGGRGMGVAREPQVPVTPVSPLPSPVAIPALSGETLTAATPAADTATIQPQPVPTQPAPAGAVTAPATVAAPQAPDAGAATGFVSEKNIIIPVPLEGEVYIRYGTPAAGAAPSGAMTVPKLESLRTDSAAAEAAARVRVDTSVQAGAMLATTAETQRVDTAVQAPGARAQITRSELDSLMSALRNDIRIMLAAGTTVPAAEMPTRDTMTLQPPRDSLVAALQAQLEEARTEGQRRDSLVRIQRVADSLRQDSIAEARVQTAVSEQVAAALAARPAAAGGEITQADLDLMLRSVTGRMDTVMAYRAAQDSARIRDQIQLEVTRRTRSDEEFQRELAAFMRRYEEDRLSTPSAIVVTQPAPAAETTIQQPEPTTVVLKPDTQYVILHDTVAQTKDTLAIPVYDVADASETSFLDLKPTGYIGFGLEQPRQFVLGGRLDVGRIVARHERLRLVPELAVGFGGGGVSVMAVMNGEYRIVDIETGDLLLVPYGRMGFGILGFGGDIPGRDTEGVVNFTFGLSVDARKAGWLTSIGDPSMFIEYQIIDLFDLNRLALGLQWSP